MDENGKLTLGSLFSGSGAFELGGLLAGIRPVFAAEVEPFPIRVTTKRLPFVKHYGDVNSIRGDEVEPVDIITFGSPCQNLSIAGKRAGLDGKQSSLFFQAIRIIKEMRCATDGRYPRFIVWENVPGAFSSNKGEDFRAVLEAVCSVKDGDIALVNKNWTLKLYFFAYNPQLLYGCICFPVLFGRQISQCVCWPFLVEKFYICLHLFWNVFALQMKICKQF